MHWIE
jgi:imidazolonepropionase-like amidohydrolase